ncbi:predicted protein [Naegleria gruberi]|uniref:Predicted protein n=1 Tax=Naegleria gruberi TaxID=5762 RepID=D2VI02_NAEGR|nr:uncharacterized protein NAEGRDRAFT_68508 [Naegleria gruberi]EFC43431.1 predicted protein [Naegleria gruberi]|eukprot:XP_002676175.1 predicted protein [Naegleria gruberi strain NEG-M]
MSVLDINRTGRVEHIPVCGIELLVFKVRETETKTWYGRNYYVKTIIRVCCSNHLNNSQNLIPQEYIGIISPQKKNGKYVTELIGEDKPGDYDTVKALLDSLCVGCSAELEETNTIHTVSPHTLPKYRRALQNNKLICGNVCNKCYSKYCNSFRTDASFLKKKKSKK